jgi:hypothetical protein
MTATKSHIREALRSQADLNFEPKIFYLKATAPATMPPPLAIFMTLGDNIIKLLKVVIKTTVHKAAGFVKFILL